MAKHKRPTPEQPKQVHAQEDDVFLAKSMEFSAWSRANRQTLILGVVALGLVIASAMYYRNYSETVELTAVQELEAVQQTIGFGDREVAKSQLADFLDRFDGTPYAFEAQLLLGQLHLETGEAAQAIDVLSSVTRDLDQPVALQAAFLLANAYEEQSNLEAAEGTYMRIANRAELSFQIREALEGAARVRELQGDMAGAVELYDEILDYFEDGDPSRNLYTMRKAEAEARIGT